LQASQLYRNRVGRPRQTPRVARSIWPAVAFPEIFGLVLLEGGPKRMVAALALTATSSATAPRTISVRALMVPWSSAATRPEP
jgi:hypothetical protein